MRAVPDPGGQGPAVGNSAARRRLLKQFAALGMAAGPGMAGIMGAAHMVRTAHAAPGGAASPTPQPRLNAAQSAAFRQWFVAIVNDQITRAPTPRWVHRDCAGLVRFAAAEALRTHDERWLQAMGWDRSRPLPPEPAPRAEQSSLGRRWRVATSTAGPFASALALVQFNTVAVGHERSQALPGDLLFFDQGDDQHLMVWTGGFIAYHTGAEPTAEDNGLRRLRWERLLAWPDTRWRPSPANPNYAGLHRFDFLT